MLRSPAREPTPCGSPTILLPTKKVRRLSTKRCRQAGRTWFVTFWRRESIPSSSMPTARSRSIWSPSAAMAEDEAKAKLRRLMLPRPTRGAEQALLPPREPEVVAALQVEASVLRLQPRSARCCKTRCRTSSPARHWPGHSDGQRWKQRPDILRVFQHPERLQNRIGFRARPALADIAAEFAVDVRP